MLSPASAAKFARGMSPAALAAAARAQAAKTPQPQQDMPVPANVTPLPQPADVTQEPGTSVSCTAHIDQVWTSFETLFI
jgi:hypothetical protein